MAISIARRKFIVALGSTAVGWPLVARAAVPVIGYLGLLSPEAVAPELAAFRQGLSETAYVEGQNVAIDYRWAHGQYDQLPALAFDLVRQRVTVLAALGTPASALAAKTATTTIPIVFVTGDDPVRIGLVDSLNRPGGNATGVYMLTSALEPKRLELIHELVPNTTAVGVIVDPSSPDTSLQMKELPAAASALGQQIKIFNARSEAEIDTAFAAIVEQRIGAVLVASSPSFLPRRQRFVALAAAHALPAVYFVRPFADVGGLMSYGTNIVEPFRQVGLYAGRILKGEKPADLPVQQSVKVELVINLKTAKVLGITVPLSLLGRADEVIE
ncbi:MAG: ABC transporter substrate-binding protein [Xanthobacteraceae bacterium]|jgi:putative tryptophan/tyrosine transport system substrate-binding protein